MAGLIPRPVLAPRSPRGPYEIIAAELRAQIATGQLQPGDQLPPVVARAAEHSVSAGTAHRALDQLHQGGLIQVSRGRRATVVG
jgi:integrase